jgi:hypothetical protein
MRGVSFDGFNQLRNEIMPLTKLYVDISKGVLTAVTEPDETIVQADEPEDDDEDNYNNDDNCHATFLRLSNNRSSTGGGVQ